MDLERERDPAGEGGGRSPERWIVASPIQPLTPAYHGRSASLNPDHFEEIQSKQIFIIRITARRINARRIQPLDALNEAPLFKDVFLLWIFPHEIFNSRIIFYPPVENLRTRKSNSKGHLYISLGSCQNDEQWVNLFTFLKFFITTVSIFFY